MLNLLQHDREVIQQLEAINRKYRIDCLLAFTLKKKETTNIVELERLEEEYKRLVNPDWFVSYGYIEKINNL